MVTGHAGYIGATLVPRLARHGHTTLGVDAYLYGTAPMPADDEIALDVRDITMEHLEGVDGVVHLAALSNDPLGALDPSLTTEVNETATVRLVRLARAAGVRRFVFLSSCSVYGQQDGLLDEHSPVSPLTSYSRSKVRAEAAMTGAPNGMSVVVLRAGTVFGWSPAFRGDLVVNRMVLTALGAGVVQVHGDGAAWRPLVAVGDVARAAHAALEAAMPPGERIVANVVGEGGNRRVVEIGHAVARACGASLELEIGTPDPRSYRVAAGGIARLGVRLTESLDAGITTLQERLAGAPIPELTSVSRVDQLRAALADRRLGPTLRSTPPLAASSLAPACG